MPKVTANYEVLFIVNATIGEEAIASTVEKFTTLISQNGEITSVNEWGKRRLAYAIEDMTEGYYVLVEFTSLSSLLSSTVSSTSQKKLCVR